MVTESDEVPRSGAGRENPSGISRLVRVVTIVELSIGAVALLMIFGLILVQAGQRYLPVDGWTWTGELARFSLVWLTFSVAGVLVTRDGHIALQLVDNLKNPNVVKAIHVFALVLVGVIGLGYAWASWTIINDSGNLTTPSLRLPMPYVYAVPFLGFVSTAIRAFVAAADVARNGIRPGLTDSSVALEAEGLV